MEKEKKELAGKIGEFLINDKDVLRGCFLGILNDFGYTKCSFITTGGKIIEYGPKADVKYVKAIKMSKEARDKLKEMYKIFVNRQKQLNIAMEAKNKSDTLLKELRAGAKDVGHITGEYEMTFEEFVKTIELNLDEQVKSRMKKYGYILDEFPCSYYCVRRDDKCVFVTKTRLIDKYPSERRYSFMYEEYDHTMHSNYSIGDKKTKEIENLIRSGRSGFRLKMKSDLSFEDIAAGEFIEYVHAHRINVKHFSESEAKRVAGIINDAVLF